MVALALVISSVLSIPLAVWVFTRWGFRTCPLACYADLWVITVIYSPRGTNCTGRPIDPGLVFSTQWEMIVHSELASSGWDCCRSHWHLWCFSCG